MRRPGGFSAPRNNGRRPNSVLSNPPAALALLALLGLLLAPPAATAAPAPDDIPVAARLVLREVSNLMDKEAYDEAIETIAAFRARGGPAPSADAPDPKGYRHPMLDLALGNLYLLKADYPQALAPLRRVVAAWPDRVDAWLNLAKAGYETGAYDEAAAGFAAAYQRSPEKDPEHLYFSAVAHLMAKSHAKAIEAFERLFAAHPQAIRSEWRENFVQALMAAEMPRRALPLVKELAARSTGGERRRWQEMGLHLYLQLEMPHEARTFVRRLVEEDPATARWWKALVHVELAAGRHAEALAALTVYGYLEPLTDEEKKLWADLNLQLQIPARAAPVYAELLERAPDRKLLEKLIAAYRQMARYDEALAQLDRHGGGQNDPKLLMLRADLLYAARRFGEAAAAYRLAAGRDRQAAGQAWLMAGYAAWQVNDLETSRRAFREASQFRRHKKAAQQAMRQLEALN